MIHNWDFDISHLVSHVPIPKVCRVRQLFDRQTIANLEQHTAEQVRARLTGCDLTGKTVAITVGSRGIAGLLQMLRAVIAVLQEKGAEPFIVPAMGSHAGATAEGQRQYLKNLGVDEDSTGVEIRSSMETVIIGHLEDGMPVYCDKLAAAADAVVVMNKIKPHSNFKGEIESGLCKMMAIGLGKRDGAAMLHSMGYHRFPETLQKMAQCFLTELNVLFGLGIVENAYDQPMLCEAIAPEALIAREKELLCLAKENIPRIQMEQIDVLVVDQIGKNVSGQGMDPNVTGRSGGPLRKAFREDFVDRIVVLGLTEETHGAFAGLGMSDYSTIRVARELDFQATYVNEVTSRTTPPARIPFLTQDDEQAVRLALYACDAYSEGEIGLVHIRDTNHLEDIEVSPKALEKMIPGTYDFYGEDGPTWYDLSFENGRLKQI